MKSSTVTIPNAVIHRLPRYYRYLRDIMDEGVERISSIDLSKRMGVTASQVRQDLNHFGDFGQQGYGYNVAYLREEIAKILGLSESHPVIIFGAGHLGTAIANHSNFPRRGFEILTLFDNDPKVIGTTINGMLVRDENELESFLAENKVEIAILALPKAVTQSVADRLISLGVRYFLNFAPVDLRYDDPSIIVESVHISDSMMTLSYRIAKSQEEKKG